MKKVGIIASLVLAVVAMTGVSFMAMADAEKAETDGYIRSHNIEPCSSWRYLRTDNGGGYACSYRGSRISVPDSYDLNRYITNLENAILDLQARVEALEAAKK